MRDRFCVQVLGSREEVRGVTADRDLKPCTPPRTRTRTRKALPMAA